MQVIDVRLALGHPSGEGRDVAASLLEGGDSGVQSVDVVLGIPDTRGETRHIRLQGRDASLG